MTVVAHSPRLHLHHLRLLVAHALPHLAWRHHGIGVLQAYLHETDEADPPEVRVHVWHPSLVMEGMDPPGRAHDHRFHLHSTVLAGDIEHVEYHLTPDPEGAWRQYEVVNARAGHDAPTPLPQRYHAATRSMILRAGDVYEYPIGAFHHSAVRGLVVTLVSKLRQEKRRARLLCPHDAAPRHGFEASQRGPWDALLADARRALLP